jgi:histidine triad (HIT) family protein
VTNAGGTADCLFCGIVARTVPAQIVHEDDDVLVFTDIRPVAPFHVLVIPKTHVASLAEADPRLAGVVAAAAARAASDAGYAERGYRVVANTGPAAGQSVSHLHVHVLAGRALGWPPG